MTPPTNPVGGEQALLSELARVKAIFQLRAIATHMGIPADHVAPKPQGEEK